MTGLLVWLVGEFLVAFALGWLLVQWENARWWRRARHYLPQPVATTTPPTVIELHAPTWPELQLPAIDRIKQPGQPVPQHGGVLNA